MPDYYVDAQMMLLSDERICLREPDYYAYDFIALLMLIISDYCLIITRPYRLR